MAPLTLSPDQTSPAAWWTTMAWTFGIAAGSLSLLTLTARLSAGIL